MRAVLVITVACGSRSPNDVRTGISGCLGEISGPAGNLMHDPAHL